MVRPDLDMQNVTLTFIVRLTETAITSPLTRLLSCRFYVSRVKILTRRGVVLKNSANLTPLHYHCSRKVVHNLQTLLTQMHPTTLSFLSEFRVY